jgi:hypothetical protein
MDTFQVSSLTGYTVVKAFQIQFICTYSKFIIADFPSICALPLSEVKILS